MIAAKSKKVRIHNALNYPKKVGSYECPLQLKVDKKALMDAAQVDPGIFRNVCNSILVSSTIRR